MDEGDALANKDSDRVKITPLSVMMMAPHGASVTTMMIVNTGTEKTYVVGFDPDAEGWEKIEDWDRDDWSIEKQDAAVEEWARATYGEDIDHSFVNTDEI